MIFYSITLSARCQVASLDLLASSSTKVLVDKMRPNFFFDDGYYPCQLMMDNDLNPGEECVIDIQLIPAVPLGIKSGDVFQIRSAQNIIANGMVLDVKENKKIEP